MTQELRTIDPQTDEPYETRFKNASTARTYYQNLRDADRVGARERAQVSNQLDGGQPFNPQKLKGMNQSWRANHNFKTAKADLEKIEIPYWRLIDSAPKVANMEVRREEEQAALWRDIMEEEFDSVVKSWVKYFYSVLTLNHEHCKFGFGGAFFSDNRDWTWEPVGRTEVLVDRESKADVKDQEVICVKRKISPTALWKLVKDDESASKATEVGWSIAEVKKLLTSISRGENNDYGRDDWEKVQARIRNNDLYLHNIGHVKTVEIYVREFDETITKYVLAEEAYANTPDIESAEEYLFQEPEYVPDMVNMLGTVFFSIGTGDWYSVKGFGQDNFNHAMVENRSMCRMLDTYTMFSAMGFKDTREQGVEEVPIKFLGPVYVIPNGLDEYKFSPNLEQMIGVRNLFRENSQENSAVYTQTSEKVARADSATQGEIIAAIDASINQAQAGLYLSQFGANVLTEMFRRIRAKDQNRKSAAGKAAKKFQERCIERDVPEEILHDADVIVTAGGDSTMANPAHRLQALNNMIAVSTNQNMDERNILIDYTAAQFGLSAAKRYITQDVDADLTDGASYAQLENIAFENGKGMPVLPEQDDEEHLPVHLREAGTIADLYDTTGQITPQGHASLSMSVPHMEAHLAKLQRQPNKGAIAAQFAGIVQQVKGKLEGININMERKRAAQFQEQEENQPVAQ